MVLWGKSEEELRVMVAHFAEVCRGRCLKFNTDKNKMMVQNIEDRLECEVLVNRV